MEFQPNFGRISRVMAKAVFLIMLISAVVTGAAGQNKACGLVTVDELQGVLGNNLSPLRPQSLPTGASMCLGQTPTARVLLRVAKTTDSSGEAERKGAEMAKHMGFTGELKRFGPITCSTAIPPANLAQYGFNTTCSVIKQGQVGAVEVTAKNQKDMVPIDKLRPLAEKIAARL